MKRPIAMRCTQEQFESIKDRFNTDQYNKYSIYKSEYYPYLFNYYYGTHNDLCIGFWFGNDDVETYETFNADIFLEACGVEVEKVWKGSEMQYKNDYNEDWVDCENAEYRLKPKPDYTSEIAELENKIKELKRKML